MRKVLLLVFLAAEKRCTESLIIPRLVSSLSKRVAFFRDGAPLDAGAGDLQPGIETINAHNQELFGKLDALRESDDFRFYSVDILASCEYMPQELFECYTESCEIYPVDEGEVRCIQPTHLPARVEL